mmetsp:Transcript_74600/g.218520  ORF Transcript_74600/g.218520 Transcript_74600/m.218520 type:complete len:210 (-) Transcript_74600:23-652(-)
MLVARIAALRARRFVPAELARRRQRLLRRLLAGLLLVRVLCRARPRGAAADVASELAPAVREATEVAVHALPLGVPDAHGGLVAQWCGPELFLAVREVALVIVAAPSRKRLAEPRLAQIRGRLQLRDLVGERAGGSVLAHADLVEVAQFGFPHLLVQHGLHCRLAFFSAVVNGSVGLRHHCERPRRWRCDRLGDVKDGTLWEAELSDSP